MADAATRLMTTDEFLAWEQGRTLKHELVDGVPRMMSGGTRAHSRISFNAQRLLEANLADGPCRPWNSDLKVRIPNGNIRYPDVSVDCGPYASTDIVADQPVAVFEVLSPSTHLRDFGSKLPDDQRTPSIRSIVFLEQDAPQAYVWTRDGDRWFSEVVASPDGVVVLAPLGVELAIAALYGVEFPPAEDRSEMAP